MVDFINMENMLKQMKEHFSLKATKDWGEGGAEHLRKNTEQLFGTHSTG